MISVLEQLLSGRILQPHCKFCVQVSTHSPAYTMPVEECEIVSKRCFCILGYDQFSQQIHMCCIAHREVL